MKYLLKIIVLLLILYSIQGFGQNAITIEGYKNVQNETITKVKFDSLYKTNLWKKEFYTDTILNKKFIKLAVANKREQQRNVYLTWTQNIIGTPAPDFNVEILTNEVIKNSVLKNKVVLLNFWFTTCRPCINEIPGLNTLYEKYKTNDDVVLLSLCLDDKEKILKFLKKYTIKMPISAESTENIKKFNVTSYPTNIIIDKKGNYLMYLSGGYMGITKHMDIAIEKALKGADEKR